MSAQGLAFTAPFVVESNTQFRPGPPRALASATYTEDFNAVKALGRRTGSTRTDAQTELAPFWEGNASVHWNQAANQIARADHLSMSDSNRLLAVLNVAMADTAFTIWSAKRHYGADPAAGDLAAADGDHAGRHGRQSRRQRRIPPGSRSSPHRPIRNTRPATRPSTAPPRPSSRVTSPTSRHSR